MPKSDGAPAASTAVSLPVLTGQKVYLNIRDFSGDERLKHLAKKLIKRLGARLTLSLQDASVVVFSNGSDALFQNATAIGKPVVTVEWLVQCKEAQALLPFGPFHVMGTVISKSGLLQSVTELQGERRKRGGEQNKVGTGTRPYLMDDDFSVAAASSVSSKPAMLEPLGTQQLTDNLEAILHGVDAVVQLARHSALDRPGDLLPDPPPASVSRVGPVCDAARSAPSAGSAQVVAQQQKREVKSGKGEPRKGKTEEPAKQWKEKEKQDKEDHQAPNVLDADLDDELLPDKKIAETTELEPPLTLALSGLRAPLASRRLLRHSTGAPAMPTQAIESLQVPSSEPRGSALPAKDHLTVEGSEKELRKDERRKKRVRHETAENPSPAIQQPPPAASTSSDMKTRRPAKRDRTPPEPPANALRPPPQRIVISGQDRDQKSVLRAIVESLGVEVPQQLFGRVRKPTHLVVVGEDVCLPLLLCKALGIPILNPSWIYESLSAGAFIVPSQEHLHSVYGHYPEIAGDDNSCEGLPAPPKDLKALHDHLEDFRRATRDEYSPYTHRTSHILSGMTFVLLGQGTTVTTTHVAELVDLLGGSIQRYSPSSGMIFKPDGRITAVLEMDGGLEFNRIMFASERPIKAQRERDSLESLIAACGRRVVIIRWLVDTILSSTVMPFDFRYVVANLEAPAVASHGLPATPARHSLSAAAKPSCGAATAIKQPSRQLNTQQLQNSQAPDQHHEEEDESDVDLIEKS
jgi:hypothetical protein